MVLHKFSLLVTLQLDLSHISWSDLQNISGLVHLESLHLHEVICCSCMSAPLHFRAFAREVQTDHHSPFLHLTNLTSLQLTLHDCSPIELLQRSTTLLQPITCMTKLCSLTLLMQGSYCAWDIQDLSQLSALTSLGIRSVEEGLSTMTNLQHLSAWGIEPPSCSWTHTANVPSVDLITSLVMLTQLKSLDCGRTQLSQVSYLTVLTALGGLTMIMPTEPFNPAESATFWSCLSKLPSLQSLETHNAFLNAEDFRTVALMTQLTKLHFCGWSMNFHFTAEDIDSLSALSSLQYLHLELIHGGEWCGIVSELDMSLKTMLQSTRMQYFQIIDGECDCDEYDSDEYADLYEHWE